MDDLLDLGGVAQMQGAFDGCGAAGIEPVDHQRDQGMGHHFPHRRRGIQRMPAHPIQSLPHARLQCLQGLCSGELSTTGGDQAAHFGPAHALVTAEQVGQRLDDVQLLGIFLVDLAGKLRAEHPDSTGFQLQHRPFALHARSQALGSNGAAFIRHPLHAVRLRQEGTRKTSPFVLLPLNRGFGWQGQNSTHSGQVFHTLLFSFG